MRFLLDTCVISELSKKQPDPCVVQWISGVDENNLFISALTIGEIYKGIEKLPDSAKKNQPYMIGLLTILKNGFIIVSFRLIQPLLQHGVRCRPNLNQWAGQCGLLMARSLPQEVSIILLLSPEMFQIWKSVE